LFARQTARQKSSTASTGGRTIYAVGDIHGRLDLLQSLLAKIEKDASLASKPDRRPMIVFVGDYVDRGPSSRAVIDRILAVQRARRFEVSALRGNHENTLLEFLRDPMVGPIWTLHGGTETLLDYGVTPPAADSGVEAWETARQAFGARLPRPHLEFLQGLRARLVVGDYLFVHAGVRPGVPLSEQSEHDLLTIRRDFLARETPFEKLVVHGHTPTEAPFSGPYRINVDTGAYATGVLTAVRLEGSSRRFLQARADRALLDGKARLPDFRAQLTSFRRLLDG
jgi:serine/threonine protein phosphatase 1